MTKTLNLILAGSLIAGATASAQLAPPAQEGGSTRGAPHQQGQIQLEPEKQSAPKKDPAQMQADLQKMHGELEEISLRLNEIHQEALLGADVRQLLIDYETTLNEKVANNAPGLEAQVETHANVLAEIGEIDGDGASLDSDERQQLDELLERHAEVKQQLGPIEGQLMNDPEMQAARGDYQQQLIAAMQEVNSDVNEIIEERMELAQNFMALQQEFIQARQPAQGQAPRGVQPGG